MSWKTRNEKVKEVNKKIFGSEDRAREVLKKNKEVKNTQEHELPYWEGRDHS
jgi:hypothetical protein